MSSGIAGGLGAAPVYDAQKRPITAGGFVSKGTVVFEDIAKQAGLSEGDCVALALDANGAIVLRPTRRRYELAELVSQIKPKNRHRETDWGRPLGEESW